MTLSLNRQTYESGDPSLVELLTFRLSPQIVYAFPLNA